MPGYCLAMLAGASSLLLFEQLPSSAYLASIAAAAFGCLFLPSLRHIAFVLLGLSAHWLAALLAIADFLPPSLEGQNLEATVVIESFPVLRGDSVRFLAGNDTDPRLPARMRLSWFDATAVPRIGETWVLQVRLRRPRGFVNPHGFDYEAWLLRQGIGATGYVVASPSNRNLGEPGIAYATLFRRNFVERVARLLPDDDATAVLLAIAVGARHRITPQQWDRYAVSGTSHLMAISGLHVGLAAAGVFLLIRGLASLVFRSLSLRDIAFSRCFAGGNGLCRALRIRGPGAPCLPDGRPGGGCGTAATQA